MRNVFNWWKEKIMLWLRGIPHTRLGRWVQEIPHTNLMRRFVDIPNSPKARLICWLIEAGVGFVMLLVARIIDAVEADGTVEDILFGTFGRSAIYFTIVTMLTSTLFELFSQGDEGRVRWQRCIFGVVLMICIIGFAVFTIFMDRAMFQPPIRTSFWILGLACFIFTLVGGFCVFYRKEETIKI